jgi:hypothetical protein
VQLERLRKDDERSTLVSATAADRDAALTHLTQESRLKELQLENQTLEIASLRRQVASAVEEKDEQVRSIEGVGHFLLACMADVREKVVEVRDATPPEEDAMITVLPGACHFTAISHFLGVGSCLC